MGEPNKADLGLRVLMPVIWHVGDTTSLRERLGSKPVTVSQGMSDFTEEPKRERVFVFVRAGELDEGLCRRVLARMGKDPRLVKVLVVEASEADEIPFWVQPVVWPCGDVPLNSRPGVRLRATLEVSELGTAKRDFDRCRVEDVRERRVNHPILQRLLWSLAYMLPKLAGVQDIVLDQAAYDTAVDLWVKQRGLYGLYPGVSGAWEASEDLQFAAVRRRALEEQLSGLRQLRARLHREAFAIRFSEGARLVTADEMQWWRQRVDGQIEAVEAELDEALELGPEFFEGAVLTQPGDDLIAAVEER